MIEALETPRLMADGNDAIREAADLSVNPTAAGGISPGTDVDMYRVTVGRYDRLSIDVDRRGSTSFDGYLRLFNRAGTQLASNDNGAAEAEALGRSPYLAHTFPTAGTYYIGVSGRGNRTYNAVTGSGDRAGSTGTYRITVLA